MNILVLGTGGVGAAAAKIAKKRDPDGKWLSKMVLADYNLKTAQKLSKFLADERFPAEKVDAKDQASITALVEKHKIDIVLNACDPSCNESIFDAAYACGINYMDMALSLSVPHPEKPYEKTNIVMGDYQFKKHKDWQEKGLLALVGMGIDPGCVNVFARYAHKHYFDEIDEISIKDGGNLSAEGYDILFGFSIWTTIDECLNPPFAWEKDKGLYVMEPFSQPETFIFPDGVGEQELVSVEHEEVPMLARSMGDVCKKITFKYGLGADFITMLKNLRALGLDDKHSLIGDSGMTPRDVVARTAPDPRDTADKVKGKCCVGTVVTGKKDGKQRKVFLYQTTDNETEMKRIGSGCVVAQTAYNPVIAMELLATGIWKDKGVLGPESFDPDPYIDLADAYEYYMGFLEMESAYSVEVNKKALKNR